MRDHRFMFYLFPPYIGSTLLHSLCVIAQHSCPYYTLFIRHLDVACTPRSKHLVYFILSTILPQYDVIVLHCSSFHVAITFAISFGLKVERIVAHIFS